MENPHITQYLNEKPNIVYSLRQLLLTNPAPMLTFHFNQKGHFFLVCRTTSDAIGFVKLQELPGYGSYEIVYVIGEERLWDLDMVRARFVLRWQPFLENGAEKT